MPRTDVPAPGQGKRSRRKAWRDNLNADQSIAIYGLAAAETPETIPVEDLEAASQALPYWDDAPQPHSHSHSPGSQQHVYTEEEIQELVEKAYHEGWQLGVEEGYKLGKDKRYKEYKVKEEEKEIKKTKNEATTACQDISCTPASSKMNASTTSGSPILEIAEIDEQAVPGGTTHSEFATTATTSTEPLSAASRSSTLSISTISSSPSTQNIEIEHSAAYNTPTPPNNMQDAYFDTENPRNSVSVPYVVYNDPQNASSSNKSNPEICHSQVDSTPPIFKTVAKRDLRTLPAVSRSTTSSTPTISSSPKGQNVENAILGNSAIYNTIFSSNTTRNTCLDTGNPLYNVSDSYVAHFDSQNTSTSDLSDRDKICPLTIQIPEIPEPTPSDLQNNVSIPLLVDVDTQEASHVSGTSKITKENQPATYMPHQLPPLPSMHILDATPYKRACESSETSNTLTEVHGDPTSPENLTARSYTQSPHSNNYSKVPTPGTPSLHGRTPQRSSMSLLDIPSITIHAQTVIINNYATANSTTTSKKMRIYIGSQFHQLHHSGTCQSCVLVTTVHFQACNDVLADVKACQHKVATGTIFNSKIQVELFVPPVFIINKSTFILYPFYHSISFLINFYHSYYC